jgi:hypothetical protein
VDQFVDSCATCSGSLRAVAIIFVLADREGLWHEGLIDRVDVFLIFLARGCALVITMPWFDARNQAWING